MKPPAENIVIDDLYQAAGISTLTGSSPEIEQNGGDRILFRFRFTPSTYKALTSYYGGATGPLYLYARNLKTLRSKMFAALKGEK